MPEAEDVEVVVMSCSEDEGDHETVPVASVD